MSDYLDSLTGTTSYYTDNYSASTSSLQDALKNTDYSTASDEELMEACKSFEQYFIEQAMKGMEKMIPESDDDSDSSGTSYVEMFKDNLYEEYSELATDRGDGIGIAKMLYEQMKRNYSGITAAEIDATQAATEEQAKESSTGTDGSTESATTDSSVAAENAASNGAVSQ